MELKLETKTQSDTSVVAPGVMMTPAIDEDYWTYRVRLTDNQAVVGFPKFGLTGIGFEHEVYWNTNLPSNCETARIVEHIWHNVGDTSISRDDVCAAVAMIQNAVADEKVMSA